MNPELVGGSGCQEEPWKILTDVLNSALNPLPPDLEQTEDNGLGNGGSDFKSTAIIPALH